MSPDKSLTAKGPLNIVLIDDSWFNQSDRAVAGLAGHNLKQFTDVEEAHIYLRTITANDIDVLLTDLWMVTPPPSDDESYQLNATDRHAGLDIPAGFAFAIRVMNYGVLVAICTDSYHHGDRLVRLVHGTTVTPFAGFGRILLYEAHDFAVPGVCYVSKLDRICRYREVEATDKRKKPNKRLFEIYDRDDVDCRTVITTVRASRTRPIKDWGKVLSARLSMPIKPPGMKTEGLRLR